MMKKLLLLLFLGLPFQGFGQSKLFEKIKIFYYNSDTGKMEEFYRVGDGAARKPQFIDIEVSLKCKLPDGVVEVLLEELQAPREILPKVYSKGHQLKDTAWVMNKVIGRIPMSRIMNNVIYLEDIPYKTAYFMDSKLYNKLGFRITALFTKLGTGVLDVKSREFLR